MRLVVIVGTVLAACGPGTAPQHPVPPVAGPPAVDGTVALADGSKLELATVWQAQPTVLVFYRGYY